jgi:hemolysin III
VRSAACGIIGAGATCSGSGLAYTAGLGFYAADRRRYCHCAWHLCVMAGTACHFLAVLWYAAG